MLRGPSHSHMSSGEASRQNTLFCFVLTEILQKVRLIMKTTLQDKSLRPVWCIG